MKTSSKILKALVYFFAALTISCLAFVVLFVLVRGLPHLTPDLFRIKYTSDNASLFPAMVNTLIMVLLALLAAVPIGIFTAIYLAEYADSNNIIVRIVRVTADTLSAIPSIVYGLFGMLFLSSISNGTSPSWRVR